MELSHSECAHRTTPTKIMNDHSKCLSYRKFFLENVWYCANVWKKFSIGLKTNKSVLDQYLSYDFSNEMVENSAVIGLQLAGKAFNTYIMHYIIFHNSSCSWFYFTV